MNRIVNISILFVLVLFISLRIHVACTELRKTSESTAPADSISTPASFTGMLAPDIHYYLTLEDEHFIEASWHSGLTQEPGIKDGVWQLSGDTLTLFESDKSPLKSFLINEHQLVLIGRHGENQRHQSGSRLELVADFQSIHNHHQNLKEEGIEFVASGNEPFWNIQIDSSNALHYRTPDRSFSSVIDEIITENGVIRYQLRENADKFELTIEETYCQDTMSGFLFTRTVFFQHNGDIFEGCGKFLN